MTLTDCLMLTCTLSRWCGEDKACRWCDTKLLYPRRTWCSQACQAAYLENHVWDHARTRGGTVRYTQPQPGSLQPAGCVPAFRASTAPIRQGRNRRHHQSPNALASPPVEERRRERMARRTYRFGLVRDLAHTAHAHLDGLACLITDTPVWRRLKKHAWR